MNIHSSAAIFFRNRQPKQPEVAHFGHDRFRDHFRFEHFLFRRDQPFTNITSQLFRELFENVAIHYVPLRSHAKYSLRHGLLLVFEIQKYPFDKTVTLRSTLVD